MFLISICRVDGDSVHKRLENRTAMATSGKKTCFDAGKIGFCNCAADLKTKVKKLCTDTDLGLHYILLLGKYSKFARKNNFRALGVCSHSPARARAAGLPCHFWYSSKWTWRIFFLTSFSNSWMPMHGLVPFQTMIPSKSTIFPFAKRVGCKSVISKEPPVLPKE